MKLTTPLIVRLEPNGRKWKIAEPFSAYTDIPEEREWINVPVDFEKDFICYMSWIFFCVVKVIMHY